MCGDEKRRSLMRSLGALLISLALLSAAWLPAPAEAATNHPLIGTISKEDLDEGAQLIDVCGVAVDSKENVYLADYYQNQIVILSPDEQLIAYITNINPPAPSGTGSLNGPCDLAVDSAGRLYVNNYHQDVVRLTPSEFPPTPTTTYGPAVTISTADPTGVAVDPASDELYVNARTHVAVYDPSGAPVLAGGEPLRIGLGSLSDAYGVAISAYPGTAGRLYVAEAADRTVKVYDPALDPLNPIEVFHGAGTPPGAFEHLTDSDLAVDPLDGHLYLADNLDPHFEKPEATVYELSATGHYRGEVPRPLVEGQRPHLLFAAEPSAVAVANGNVYVSSGNQEDSKVLVFGPAPPLQTHLLSVTKSGTGAGTVRSSPPGLGCGPECVGEFDEDASVSLKAIPDPGSQLSGWSGCDTELAGQCQVTMSADRAVSAQFEPAPGSFAAEGDRAEAEPAPGAASGPLVAPRHSLIAGARSRVGARLGRRHHRPLEHRGRGARKGHRARHRRRGLGRGP